jgi:hypothetical protein
MTVLWEFRKTFRLGVPKTRKIKKVTTSQDDDFVRGLEIQMVGICRKYVKIEKVTGSQDDVFVLSWRFKNSVFSEVAKSRRDDWHSFPHSPTSPEAIRKPATNTS